MEKSKKYKLLNILLFFFTHQYCLQAQIFSASQIDSVVKVINETKDSKLLKNVTDTLKFKLSKYNNKDFVYAALLDKMSSKPSKVISVLNLALMNSMAQKGSLDSAIFYLKRTISNANALKDTASLISSYQTYANIYNKKKQLDSSFAYLARSEKLAEQDKFKEERWQVYLEWAIYYSNLGNEAKMSEFLEKAWGNIEFNKKYESQRGFVLYTIANNYWRIKNLPKHSFYVDLYLIQYVEKKKPFAHIPIKTFYIVDKDKDITINNLLNAIRLSDSLGHYFSSQYALTVLDDYYKELGKSRSSLVRMYLKTINDLKENSNTYVQIENYRRLSEIYESTNEFNKALEYYKLYYQLSDSLISTDLKLKLQKLEVEYQVIKKDEILNQNKLTIARKEKQKMTLFFLLCVAILSVLGLIFWYRNKIKSNKIIESQYKIIKEKELETLRQQNKMIVLNAILDGQEEERGRVAKDLHDGLGGLLSSVKAHFSRIQQEIQEIENLNLYEKANTLIDEACVEVRRIAHNMLPESISNVGLKAAIEDLATNIAVQGIKCEVDIHQSIDKLPHNKILMLYRIVQELTFNTVKHAQASNLMIQILEVDGFLKVLVEDNGIGFNFTNHDSKKGMGLKSVKSRVEYLNGSLMIDSVLTKGTTINIEIPF